MAPESSPCASSISPSACDSSTMERTSCAVKAEATSSLGSTPNRRSTWLASQLSAAITGRRTRPSHTSGGPNHSTARSGPATARFLGTISPSTTCRYTTMASASTNAMGCARLVLTPRACSGSSMRWAIAGSATRPRVVEQTVTPSWAHASMSETCSMAHSTVRARRLPASASGSMALRRAEMMANSAPTKNALPASRMTARRSATVLFTRAHPARRDPARCARARRAPRRAAPG